MSIRRKDSVYKIIISVLFGLLGFYSNFHTIIFHFGDYTVAVLFGLIFPLLITMSWGWKYGLLSALAGGCQSMWWLWGPSNGYAVFLVVPPFTLWILWHGIFADLRRRGRANSWKLSIYLLEIPFRILSSLIILTVSRWAISKNPPPWPWAAESATIIPMEFSVFVVIKQASVAFVLLLLADVILNINPVRAFFRLKPLVDQKRTGYVVSVSLLLGCLYWVLDSFYYAAAFRGNGSFIDYFIRDIPEANLFTRIIFLLFCLAFGTAMSRILRKQKQDELKLRQAREEALARETLLNTLFQTIPDQIWLKDLEGRYVACNARIEELFGVSEAEIVGKTDYELLEKRVADVFTEQDRKVIKDEKLHLFELDVDFASDGHRELSETIKAPMYDSNANLAGIIGIARDISERVNLRNQLMQAQKMESIGRLAGGVAHDFNNMITVILGTSELILSDLERDDKLAENIRSIKNAAERSSRLTRQLLAFARKQEISPEPMEVNSVVDGILKMLGRLIGEDIELRWLPGEDIWKILADSAQIDQILANLCVNARDAIEGQGQVSIATRNVSIDEGYCSYHKGFSPGDYVMISISDTGCGMSREDQEHIFEPFFTTKEVGKGTGLGLAMVYGIMRQHRGFVNVYSEAGRGTTFKLYFPRCTSESRPISVPDENCSLRGNERIVLVEDEAEIRKIVTMQLEAYGYEVKVFSDSRDAVGSCSREERIDLMIADVVMPGMTGAEVVRAVEEIHPRMKRLFISGYTADMVARRGILEEGESFLSKPFSGKVLARKVREILDSQD